jgi:NhaC family Na+:H+ antiporter
MGRSIPLWQILLVMLVLIASLMWTILVIDGYVHIPLIITAAFGTIIAIANGFKWNYIEKGIINNIGRSMQAILILLTVGMLIGTWISPDYL